MKNLLALPAFYVISRMPQITAYGLGLGLIIGLGYQGMSFSWLLLVWAIGALSAFAVRLLCLARIVRTTGGTRRAIYDVCWEMADRIADWAGWEWQEITPPNP